MDNKVFFIPYAGGSSATFKHWINYLRPEGELEIFEMAGHGRRFMDEPYSTLTQASEELYRYLKSKISEKENYFLAGHCMGAVILYETCILINERKEIPLPKRIFISGHGFIEYIHNEKHIKDMNDKEMINVFVKEGGMSEEYLDDELLELILPGIRADVRIYEEYTFNKNRNIPKLDMTVFYSEGDVKTPLNEINEWKKYSDNIEIIPVKGGHYFINSRYREYLDTIKKGIVVEQNA